MERKRKSKSGPVATTPISSSSSSRRRRRRRRKRRRRKKEKRKRASWARRAESRVERVTDGLLRLSIYYDEGTTRVITVARRPSSFCFVSLRPSSRSKANDRVGRKGTKKSLDLFFFFGRICLRSRKEAAERYGNNGVMAAISSGTVHSIDYSVTHLSVASDPIRSSVGRPGLQNRMSLLLLLADRVLVRWHCHCTVFQ